MRHESEEAIEEYAMAGCPRIAIGCWKTTSRRVANAGPIGR